MPINTTRNVLEIPPELKKITPYVRRAEELDQDKSNPESRLVAYYARQFAVHVGIPLSKQAPAKKCLGILLEQLEREKPRMDNFTRDESKFLCRKFAMTVFDKADGEDRMGLATKNTAKTFYAAATFLELLTQFYPDDDESEDREEEKRRIIYAKWKATEILKAIKEGRKPVPGAYGEDEDEPVDDLQVKNAEETKTDGFIKVAPPKLVLNNDVDDDDDAKECKSALPSPISSPKPSQPPTSTSQDKEEEGYEVEQGPPPAYPGELSHTISIAGAGKKLNGTEVAELSPRPLSPPAPPVQQYRPPIKPVVQPPIVPLSPPMAPSPAPSVVSNFFGFGSKKSEPVTKAQLKDAVELTRFALSALEDKDVELGAARLQQALKTLGKQ